MDEGTTQSEHSTVTWGQMSSMHRGTNKYPDRFVTSMREYQPTPCQLTGTRGEEEKNYRTRDAE